MEWFASEWPVLLVALALILIFMGLIQRLVKLAFFGVALGAIGLFVWPLLPS